MTSQPAQPERRNVERLEYCAVRQVPALYLPADLGSDRLEAIIAGRKKWVNGTVLRYYFFDRSSDQSMVRTRDGTSRLVTWIGGDADKAVVHGAFQEWKALGLGLDFVEVRDRNAADVRIGFQRGDGSWSYVGRDIRNMPINERTMNFGWDLTRDAYGRTTALHEIGHTLGMPHEHQNPYAGIVWDEAKVYAHLGGPPNNWDRQTTFENVLRKLSESEYSGSTWDPDSVMEYAFPAGLILEPARYRTSPLDPLGGLSAADRRFVAEWYPPMGAQPPSTLTEVQSTPVTIGRGQQVDFLITPVSSRPYNVGTFGQADTVLTVFEEGDGAPRFIAGDDDSGTDRNALVTVQLSRGRTYIVRIRLYSTQNSGSLAAMYW